MGEGIKADLFCVSSSFRASGWMLIGLVVAEDSRGQEMDVFWTVNRVQKFPSVDFNTAKLTAKLPSITFNGHSLPLRNST